MCDKCEELDPLEWIPVDDPIKSDIGCRVEAYSLSEGVVTASRENEGWEEFIKIGNISITIKYDDITHWKPLAKDPEVKDEHNPEDSL